MQLNNTTSVKPAAGRDVYPSSRALDRARASARGLSAGAGRSLENLLPLHPTKPPVRGRLAACPVCLGPIPGGRCGECRRAW